MEEKLNIVFTAFEADPYFKSGGLGDVAGALPPALAEAGCNVCVFLPKFSGMAEEYKDKLTHLTEFYVPLGWRQQYCGIEVLERRGVTWYFLDNEFYFARNALYGYGDDAERIAFFSKAVLESFQHIPEFQCDVLHCNDWHTSLIPVFLRELYRGNPLYDRIRTVFTVHNLKFQGRFSSYVLSDVLGLADIPAARDQLMRDGGVSYMKGAICYSDALTTVSPTYADEILHAYYGEGLDGLFNEKRDRLSGILNGIDTEEYDPEHDELIPAPYTLRASSGKHKDKAALQKKLGLEVNKDTPIVAMVSRLTEQKGMDLILRILDELLNEDVEVAILGTGDPAYEQALRDIAGRHPGRMSATIAFDRKLSHLFYAGADMLMMPSRFEPCGLSQMIGMRYGTLPVVRETGGLKDTVDPYNRYTGEGNGFSFANFNAHELLFTLQAAIRLYHDDRRTWRALMRHAMKVDVSWNASAKKYIELYQNLMEK